MKKILILGGTVFVGRSVTEALVASGKYEVTLFNRGRSNPELFSGVQQIHGDRETGDIEKILGQNWDCIIDFSAYYPVTFERLLESLKGRVGRYIFISTISVYDLDKAAGQVVNEQYELLPCSEAQKTSRLFDAYGEKKAEMERILMRHTNLDKVIFRPSYIYGKFDYTERFYYWLYRVEKCQRFLLPDGGQPKQLGLTNAADLAAAIVEAVEIKNHAAVYNTVSTPQISIRELIGLAAKAYGKKPELITVSAAELEKNALQLGQFPLLSPFDFHVSDALWKKDFHFKPADVAGTLVEMRDYNAATGFTKPKVGLDVEKEQEIIGMRGTK